MASIHAYTIFDFPGWWGQVPNVAGWTQSPAARRENLSVLRRMPRNWKRARWLHVLNILQLISMVGNRRFRQRLSVNFRSSFKWNSHMHTFRLFVFHVTHVSTKLSQFLHAFLCEATLTLRYLLLCVDMSVFKLKPCDYFRNRIFDFHIYTMQ